MHELGVAFHVIEEVTKIAKENNVKHISFVTISLGEVSGVIPNYLKDVWKWAVDKEKLTKGCELKIEKIRAITICNSCKKEYQTIMHGKKCPFCKSEDTVLKTGNEFIIKEIGADS